MEPRSWCCCCCKLLLKSNKHKERERESKKRSTASKINKQRFFFFSCVGGWNLILAVGKGIPRSASSDQVRSIHISIIVTKGW
jgi:hypothetical protein